MVLDPATVETVRLWLSPVTLLAIFGVVFGYYIKVRTADTADRRLALEVEKELRDEIRKIKVAHESDRKQIREELDKCEELRDRDREKIDALKDLLAGYGRVFIQQADSGAIVALGDYPSDEIRRASNRVERLFKEKDDDASR
jgi:hypothetical protein